MAEANRKNNRSNFRKNKPQSEYEQRIIDLARVTRVMAGGKRLRFRACVALGDRKGKIGWAVAKGADVAIAVSKAANKAKKYMVKIRLVDETIPHKVEAKFKAAQVMLKPAVKGTGIIAGGAVRQILELAGIPNIYSKILGGSNKISNIQATLKALSMLKYPEDNLANDLVEESVENGNEEEKSERDLDKEEELYNEQKKLLRKEGIDEESQKKSKLLKK